VLLALLTVVPSLAENAERGQRQAEAEVLPKLNLLCGVTFTVTYDLASLKANDKDIGYDQTDGAQECDEPLRILWTLCQTEAGKALVRRSELHAVECFGVKGGEGSLKVKHGVITVERANEESDAHLRARVQFEKALGVKVAMKVPYPYDDQAWREFRQAPAPVTSTTDYCLVNGEKVKFDSYPEGHLRGDGTVKCLKNGQVVTDFSMKNRRKTGLARSESDDGYRVEHFVDGRAEGRTEQYRKGVLVFAQESKNGERVWRKEFGATGKLRDYLRQLDKGQLVLRLTEDGRVTSLHCAPEARDDEVLEPWCGFGGEKTVEVYDGTNKVSAVRTFRDGLLVREAPGDSHYAARSAVAYEGGKKTGVERLTREDGTLERTVTWKAGEQEGPEEAYSKDGKKVVSRTEWKAGEQVGHDEFFLNGHVKSREGIDGQVELRSTFFDLGQAETEERFVRCGRNWCEDGVHKRFFENGKPAEETHWSKGKQQGEAKQWFDTGAKEREETWVDGLLTKRRAWDAKGAMIADDEFEEDGSRKDKR
jgi:antitoxin component YwqK of YwqJK toxin-antitoxin module